MPDWLRYVRDNLPPLHVRPEREAEIAGELAQQLDDAYREALAAGASEQEAAARARAQFPDWTALADGINAEQPAPRQPRRISVFAGAGHDVRYALRLLTANRSFSAIAVLTLALGIGAATAIFTLVDTLGLRNLPYPQPDQLMAVETRKARSPEVDDWTSFPDFLDVRQRVRSFSAVAAISPVWSLVLTGNGDADRLEALFVSAELFPMLGVTPAMGRVFSREEDSIGSRPVVLISHSLWHRRFGANPKILGAVLTFGGTPSTIIGVLPRSFQFIGEPVSGTTARIDVWAPLAANPLVHAQRSVRFLNLVGRLRPGTSAQQAAEEVRALGASLAATHPESNNGFEMGITPLKEQALGPLRPALLLLLASVIFVLLMACANVSGLLLSRAAGRDREISVRLALGASAARLFRQLLTEALVFALAGGIIAAFLAHWMLRVIVSIMPETFLRRSVALDTRALLFAFAAVLFSALLSGAPGLWRARSAGIAESLRIAARSLTSAQQRLRAGLVTVQVALAVVLLIAAGLLVRSFVRLLEVDPGFRAENLITVSTQVPSAARTPEQRKAIYAVLRERIPRLPGVVSVAAVSRLPFGGQHLGSWLWKEDTQPGGEKPELEYRIATPGWFQTMGIPLVHGRFFEESDDPRASTVAVINEAAARRFWPNEDAVGKRIKLGATNDGPWITIIGVAGNVRHFGLEAVPRPEVYRPYAHNPLGAPVLLVRTRGDAASAMAAVAAAVRSVNPEMPAYNVFQMADLVAKSTAVRRFVMTLVMAFAVMAMLLAAVGLYGVVSEQVAQRTREIGLRMAVGAAPGQVMRLVLGHGFRMVLVGTAIGYLAALGVTRLLAGLLFGVTPLDNAAYAAPAIVLGVATLVACWAPARRATRVDPVVALRQE